MKINGLIYRQCRKFFEDLEGASLLFTTFGLDEEVAGKVLDEFKVPAETEITILHDIMHHKKPGFLALRGRAKCKTIAVELNGGNNKCPVFHAKIWAHIKGDKIVKMYIPSFNLTRFHFSRLRKTYESGILFDDVNFEIPDMIKKARNYKGQRIKSTAVTFCIDTLGGESGFTETRRCAGETIRENFAGRKVESACSPFISVSALKKLSDDDLSFCVWTGKNGKNMHLHAKIIKAGDRVAAGSVNLTQQALWGLKNKAFNTEVVVMTGYKGALEYEKMKFKKIALKKCGDYEDKRPGDVFGIPLEAESWSEQRLLRIKAPDSVSLRFCDEINSYVDIVFMPEKRKTKVCMLSCGGEKIKISGRIQSKSNQEKIAKMLSKKDTIMVSGKGWETDLDIGKFWNQVYGHRAYGNAVAGEESRAGGRKKSEKTNKSVVFQDVREIRKNIFNALKHGESTEKSRNMLKWFGKYCPEVYYETPEWCYGLMEVTDVEI